MSEKKEKNSGYSRIRRWRMMKMIIRNTYADKVLYQFLVGYFISAGVIWLVEPEITRYPDALWYLFAAASTVGFGDITAVTLIGRILTVYVAISGILVVAIVPAVIINYYQEVLQTRQRETVTEFMDKLEHLPELSREELEEISEKVKQLNQQYRKKE